jgi:hypothetical protein
MPHDHRVLEVRKLKTPEVVADMVQEAKNRRRRLQIELVADLPKFNVSS